MSAPQPDLAELLVDFADLVADCAATLDAFRRDGGEVVPVGVLAGLPTEALPPVEPRPAPGLPPRAPPSWVGDSPRGGGEVVRLPAPAARPAAAPTPRFGAPSAPAAPGPTPGPAPGARVAAPAPAGPSTPPSAAPPVPRPAAVLPPRPAAAAPPPPRPAEGGAGLFGAKWAARLADPAASLRAFQEELAGCGACARAGKRQLVLVGEGPPRSPVLLLTGPPTPEEEDAGALLPGPEGELLAKMLLNVLSLERGDVHVAAALPCGGGEVEVPERIACSAHIARRVELVGPRVVLVMGAAAARALGWPPDRRGWTTLAGVPACYTWHPSELLADPAAKRPTFEHLKEVRARIG